MSVPRSVDQAIARFDELAARFDGATPAARQATRREYGRTLSSIVRRGTNMGMAIGALIVATIAFAFIVGPIGMGGLFAVLIATFFIMLFFSVWPAEKSAKPFDEAMPNRQVVERLDAYLHRRRTALPAPAGRRIDAIVSHLPLLESRLAEADILDPLAQDARRLMGKHLPELIERYERVPPAYRHERDGEGKTVDERLLAGLEAADAALGDIGAKLAREDLDAFETQGRFIESRYKDGSGFKAE